MNCRPSLLACAFSLALAPAFASDPSAHDLEVPATPGATLTVEWTGSALPGATGVQNECLAAGPDDSHDINLTVPEGFYDGANVTADFHIEWEPGFSDPTGTANLPDLVLSVVHDGEVLGSSDGGSPEENVGIANPAAGTYTAIVCPYLSVQPTPYRAKLTLTVRGATECLLPPTKAIAASTVASMPKGFDGNAEFAGWPDVDAFRIESATTRIKVPTDLQGRWQHSQFDRTLGATTFLWARKDAPVPAVGALASEREMLIARARAHLRSESKKLKLTPAMIDAAEVIDAQYNGDGPAVVRFAQRAGGREVFRRTLNVLLDRAGKPVAVSGYFATDYDPASVAGLSFNLGAPQAIAAAWQSLGGSVTAAQFVRSASRGVYETFAAPALAGTHVFERQPRAKAVLYPRQGALVPGHYVELFALARATKQRSAYAFVISALDGSVLYRDDLIARAAYSYRVFADDHGMYFPYDGPMGNGYIPFPGAGPDEVPNAGIGTTNLVTLEHAGIVTGDPWLPDGATVTTGNHVDACIDRIDVQGVPIAVPPPVNSCLPGLEPRTPTTSASTFDYALQAYDDPSTADGKNAAVVNMFYMINWLHDWWYNHGFDEVSGNAQTSNYGRGGAEGDPLLAQGQDASGRNNANMATPSDGSSPVMQQYLFNGIIKGAVEITEPALGSIAFNGVEYGPQTFDFTGEAVLATDGFEPASDGCTGLSTPAVPVSVPVIGGVPQVAVPVIAPDTNLLNKIAIIDRGGGCPGSYKVRWALLSGASAVVLVHDADGPPPYLVNGDVPIDSPVQPTNQVYQLPIVTIRKDDGQRIKDALAGGATVTMRLRREPTVDLDGTLDNLIIAHEYFHYVHHRLTNSSNPQAGAMSEGWGDIDSWMVALRDGDKLLPGNDKLQGAYPGAVYVTNDFYYGIRRAPYSTDMHKNPLTFRHIQENEPLPTDKGPVNGNPSGAGNSEVHAAGEIWANMMFECYVGLQNDPRHTFAQAQSRMQDYIIGGLKMTPTDATFTEARDAVLAVALAADPKDYAACSKGFAKRGAGLNAISPARASEDLVGVVEDYSEFVCKAGVGPIPSVPVAGAAADTNRFGGAPGLLLLAPLLGLAAWRRRRASR